MSLLVRLTVLCVFAAAGLSMALSVCLRPSTDDTAPERGDSLAAGSSLLATPASGGKQDRTVLTGGWEDPLLENHPLEHSHRNDHRPEDPPEGRRPSVPSAASRTASELQTWTLPDGGAPQGSGSGERASPLLRDSVEEMLETALNRWTATYLPPMTRQFDELDALLKAARQREDANDSAPPAAPEPATRQPPFPFGEAIKEPLPGPPAPASVGTAPRESKPIDMRLDPDRDLISLNVPDTDIREVFKSLSEAAGINILATRSVTGNVSISVNNVDVNTALAAILKSSGFASRREGEFLYVGTPDELQQMAVASDKVSTRVYRPNYVTATELQKLITSMLSKDVGAISISTAAEVGIASATDRAGGDSFAGSDVVVVRDYETVLERMDQVFSEIDHMPRQVMIEAMILSVRLDDQNTLGVNFELLRNKGNIRLVSGGTAASLAAINFNEGLKIGFLDESLFAFINALETIGDTNVIASPRVMCVNKQRAEILIGSELGYVSTTVTETAATQSVEFLEVGTHLKIRPFISNDGMVRLEVHPELSTGTVRVDQGFTLPDKEVTQVTTNIMCRTGATVVIGGLIREDLIATSQQIPVLGNLPFLGPLFRERTEDTERREIIVLLTPRIIDEYESGFDGEKSFTESRDRRNAFFDKLQPTNKRRIADRYGRLALSAWAAGEADVALRYANLAIHYDPLHQQAVNLRQEVIAAYPHLENSTRDHLTRGLWPWQHPAVDYSGAVGWPWRDVGLETRPIPVVPELTGGSGPVREIIGDSPPLKQ